MASAVIHPAVSGSSAAATDPAKTNAAPASAVNAVEHLDLCRNPSKRLDVVHKGIAGLRGFIRMAIGNRSRLRGM
jgi:hypothetical protein